MQQVRFLQRARFAVTVVAVASLVGRNGTLGASIDPETKTVPVTDTYYGTTVADPYRWLEDGTDPTVKAWAAAQTDRATQAIHGSPLFDAYKKRMTVLETSSTERFGLVVRGARLFYERDTPPEEQPELVVRDGTAGAERVLFDPRSAAAVGGPQPAIETIAVANDGSKVAFTTQLGGSEQESLHVVDATTDTLRTDTLPNVGGGLSPVAIAWDADGNGFLHTQWPRKPDGTYATSGIALYHHVLGADPASDTYVFGNGLSPKAEFHLSTSIDGAVTAAEVTDGDGVHATIYLRAGTCAFTSVATPAAGIGNSGNAGGVFVGDTYAAVAHGHDPRGDVVALVPGGSFETAKVLVPASTLVIDGIVAVGGGFATSDIDGGDGSARLFARDGARRGSLPLPPISSITALAGDPAGGPIVFGYENYTTPDRWLAYDPVAKSLKETGIAETTSGDFSNVIAKRVFVPSLDGTVQVPLEMFYRKDLNHGQMTPTILTAYGAYGTVTRPFFDASTLAWLERGGVIAQAMVRGGGEYGDAWHLAAHLATKTKSSDDLAACAMWLGKNGFAGARHLGIIGGSAGGFLMGLAITRDPQLYRAVDAQVGIHDLLRVELTPNGAYNTGEFGTTKDPAQFSFMLRQSPYHNVHKGTPYPAILMTTGENDPRVEPYNSRKMIAMLQANSSSDNPIYLIQSGGQGHGIGSSFDQHVVATAEFATFFDMELR